MRVMYPNELKRFIEDRNYLLGGYELLKAISIEENPQLSHIEYNPYENAYRMWDCYGNYYEFGAVPYKEQQKVLKK